MTPELRLMLETMQGDIREVRADVGIIKGHLAGQDGSDKTRRHLVEAGRWAVAVIVAFFAGHVGGGAH